MAEFHDKRGTDQFKYKDKILAAQKRWEEYSENEKALFKSLILTLVEDFLLWWDTLKAIEKKFND